MQGGRGERNQMQAVREGALMPEETWFLEGDGIGVVRDSKLNAREDWLLFTDRSVTRTYGKHHLRRVIVQWENRSSVRHYWRGVRVPWIVWALFS